VIHVHDEHRVLAFQRWVPGVGHDVVAVVSLTNATRDGYEIGLPSGGFWREAFNSDVYERWVNPDVASNGGGIHATGPGRHGLESSPALTLPANSLLVVATSHEDYQFSMVGVLFRPGAPRSLGVRSCISTFLGPGCPRPWGQILYFNIPARTGRLWGVSGFGVRGSGL
jgi:hypothetical protein